jgi:hypothetical protein
MQISLNKADKLTHKVGVIGTGVDYNNPNLAPQLHGRRTMEKDIQKLERLKKDLQAKAYESLLDYVADYKQFETNFNSTGFPKWMDQALGTTRPFDQVILNKMRSNLPGGHKDHETRISSRIIKDLPQVELFSVRRAYGASDHFNVSEVVSNLHSNGVRLINMSFGWKCGLYPEEEKAWETVFQKYSDVIFVVSAGNDGENTELVKFCPATNSERFGNVISVTALNDQGELASYFGRAVNYGRNIDFAIKADNLEVLWPNGRDGKWSINEKGATSMATAQVTRLILRAHALTGYDLDASNVKSDLIRISKVSKELMSSVRQGRVLSSEDYLKLLRSDFASLSNF